ncbi:MAG TPA: hypothetical protein VFE84_12575, partial [Patescibacteria group bacterium]|nr:hypothetical protein [Patescibacteria group bacterium]
MTRRHVALAVVLALAGLMAPEAGAQLDYTRFGRNKVIYEKFDWHVYRAPHFDIYYYPEEEQFLEQMVSYAESSYLYLSKALDHEPKFRIPIIMYKNHGDFEQTNVVLEQIDESTGAFSEPLERRLVTPIDQPPDFLYKLITHEMTHIFEFSILFQDSYGRALRANPPGWLMEGLASYMAKDESNLDKMVIRDAVVNGLVPPITKVYGSSYLVYRYGHAVFDFMEQEFGKESIRSFLIEYRKILLSANIEKAIKETFAVEADEFDRRFKRYLLKKYVPLLLQNNEPADHGKEVGIKLPDVLTFSPALSPSGDLIAVMTNKAEDLDIFIINAKDGEVIRNLTKGFTNKYDHLITAIFEGKNDLSWSPDGDNVAVFARKENKRLLLLYNAVTGKQVRSDVIDVDVAKSPAFSPDGKRIAFEGNKDGQVDIFEYNLETSRLTNITNDVFYDSNPSWSSDGKTILYNRRINSYEKIFLLDYEDPAQKTQVTFGETSDVQPSFSRDGKRVYYASDAGPDGIFNIYSLDLETGEIKQYTNVISGELGPRELPEEEGKHEVVASAFWRLSFRLFKVDLEKPVKVIKPEERAQEPQEIVPFESTLKLTLDEAEKRNYDKLKFHVEAAPTVGIGVASDGTVFGNANLQFVDLLGDHRFWVLIQSLGNYSNLDLGYANLKNRWQWFTGVRDFRDYVIVPTISGRLRRVQVSRETAADSGISYPLSEFTRLEGKVGVFNRDSFKVNLIGLEDPNTGAQFGELDFVSASGTSPFIEGTLVNDTTRFKAFGPWQGKRASLSVISGLYSSGDLGNFMRYVLDYRGYRRLTSRSLIAGRLVADISNGDGAQFQALGGYNQIRGYRFREFVGDRLAYTNLELRFPLVDELRFPFGSIRQIRGLLFF